MKIQVLYNEKGHLKNVTVHKPLNDEQIALIITASGSRDYLNSVNHVGKTENSEGKCWFFYINDESAGLMVLICIYAETAEDIALYEMKTEPAFIYSNGKVIIHLMKDIDIPSTPVVAWNTDNVFQPKPKFRRKY